MILISHRGNINGPQPKNENRFWYILKALDAGYDVEIDIQHIEPDYMETGHDDTVDFIDIADLMPFKDRLWCHAKQIDVLPSLIENGFNCFYHETDKATLTSRGYIWTFPGNELTTKSICLFPDKTGDFCSWCAGICSDNIQLYKDIKNVR